MIIGFIGFGLIGGSIAKTLKKKLSNCHIMAYDEDQLSLILAYQEGKLDQYVETFEDFSSCDYIFLCVPLEAIPDYAVELFKITKSNCIITDVGSAKSSIMDQIAPLDTRNQFIGGHPMAGSEQSGFVASNDHLLENAYYLLTPTEKTHPDQLKKLSDLVMLLGALPIVIDAQSHDIATAKISHLPHVVASALVHNALDHDTSQFCQTFAAGGFKDITRIASSSPIMWENISFANRFHLINETQKFIKLMEQFMNHLAESSRDKVYDYFENAKQLRDSLPLVTGQTFLKTYQVNIDVIDEPGIIANIATLLYNHTINIKNIGINNNRDHEGGVLQIVFHDLESQQACIQLLISKGYTIKE